MPNRSRPGACRMARRIQLDAGVQHAIILGYLVGASEWEILEQSARQGVINIHHQRILHVQKPDGTIVDVKLVHYTSRDATATGKYTLQYKWHDLRDSGIDIDTVFDRAVHDPSSLSRPPTSSLYDPYTDPFEDNASTQSAAR